MELRASLGKLIINLYIDKEPRTPIITPSLVKVIDIKKRVKKKKKKSMFGNLIPFGGGNDSARSENSDKDPNQTNDY